MHLNLLIDMKVPIQDATSVLVERKKNTETLLLANKKQNKTNDNYKTLLLIGM